MANNKDILNALIKQGHGLANTSGRPNSPDAAANAPALESGNQDGRFLQALISQIAPLLQQGNQPQGQGLGINEQSMISGEASSSPRSVSSVEQESPVKKDVIQMLGDLIKPAISGLDGGGISGFEILMPLVNLANNAGTASAQTSQTGVGDKAEGRLNDDLTANLNPLDKARYDQTISLAKNQVKEASEQGVPLEDIQAQTLSDKPTDANAGGGQQSQPQGGQGQDILSQLMGVLSKGAKGFAQGFSQDFRAKEAGIEKSKAETKALSPEAIQRENFIKLGLENFKQNRLDAREVLKSDLKNQGVGGGASTIAGGVSDLISAWDDIKLKGRGGGILGALAGAGGFQRGERDAFQSFATGLAFSFGEHVLGQKGRAFTDNERKEITKNIIGATTRQTEGQFKAKMQAIIKQVNNRIPEGGEKIPDYATIRASMGRASQQTQQGDSGLLQQIQAEKQRRGLS